MAEQAISDAVNHGRPFDHEFRVVWPDGSIHHLRAAGHVTRDADGRPMQVVGVNWDVTEARQLAADLREQVRLQAETAEREIVARSQRDAAERAARAKSEFLATMSHEIRSPMSALMGVIDVLRAECLEPGQRRLADMAHSSASMLLAVLNDVLDFSKIEAGVMSVECRPVELRRMLDEVVQPHTFAAGKKGLAFTLSIDPDAPAWLLTDSLRVKQIIGNLLSNAVKFTGAGEIAVSVIVARDVPSPTLRIDVRDTGIGIEAEALSRLFRPFTQADSSTTRIYGGTGLGLAISKKLAELLQGTLSATSEPGLGSIFSLELPIAACAGRNERTVEQSQPSPAMAYAGRRALVVDDDPTIRWLSERQLKSLGFVVDTAPDGENGLTRFLAGSFDLVLTDCHMPRMDGVALSERIRAAERPACQRVPIIGVTADVTEAQRERCLAAGMSALAIKPLTLPHLSTLVAQQFAGAAAPPTPEAAPSALVFDDSIFLSILDRGDPAGAAWLGDYLQTAARELATLQGLPADISALPDLATVSHRLAGASYSAGAMRTGDAARALERAAKAADIASIPALIANTAASITAAEAAINGFLAECVPALNE
jgi:signal transduction histidine kinase